MKNILRLQIILAFVMISACAHSSKKKNPGPQGRSPASQLQTQRAQEEDLQDKKDKARVLRKKKESGVVYRAIPQKKGLQFSPKFIAQADQMNERDLYAELLDCYDRNDNLRFQSYYQSFQKRFAKSAMADDAMYLQGLFAL